jgi:hypothetical protein
MNWKIQPCLSVGDIRFGMSQAQVAQIMGPPEDVQENPIPANAPENLRKQYENYLIEFRIGTGPETIKPSIQYENGKVTALELYESIKGVSLLGFNIFESTKLICAEKLKDMSQKYAISSDDIVFLDFGISMGNDEVWEYAPSINVFAEGQFDDIVSAGIASGEMKMIVK